MAKFKVINMFQPLFGNFFLIANYSELELTYSDLVYPGIYFLMDNFKYANSLSLKGIFKNISIYILCYVIHTILDNNQKQKY